MYCPGPWKDGEKCPPPSTCMPMKSGDCWNVCPSNCPEKSCPGAMGPDGCPVADTCMPNDSFCPVHCGKDMMQCSAPMDPKTGMPMGPDTCMPMKNGDCWATCPMVCGKGSKHCPGGMDYNGCEMPAFCIPESDHCPVKCGKGEMHCSAPIDPKTGMPTGSNTCVPEKMGDCWNVCPSNCPEKSCPGPMGPNGCPVADTCMPNDAFCPANCGKDQMNCAGPMDPKTGMPTGPDTCMPMKSGDCWNTCPAVCGEKDQICYGGVFDGCPMPDICMPKEYECPPKKA